MKIVYTTTYYSPHISGLTRGLAPIAEHMAASGHEVTVICELHDPELKAEEIIAGVRIVRVPVWVFVGKGPLMPRFWFTCHREMKGADIVHIVAPQADSMVAALAARLRGARVVMSYVCSFTTEGPAGWIATQALRFSHLGAGFFSLRIVALSEDYASQSRFCALFNRKLMFIPVPVPNLPPQQVAWQRATPPYSIGFVGRISPDKSLKLLLDAIPHLKAVLDAPFSVEIAGPQEPPGTPNADDLYALIEKAEAEGVIRYHGVLEEASLDRFYRRIDVLVLPSNVRIEAYGMVQVEAMLRGTPCVVSDRPGMRLPVRETGFGVLFPPGNAQELARALRQVLLEGPPNGAPKPEVLHEHFAPGNVFAAFDRLYAGLV
ncbi:glycosyltransferase family 4 protein [Roseovarius amoyensis]|uniref:glycosyltransferase family 4 protein n=1 Tax=Roseovarius amoyensis TaxID=2211448 RepID=UPI0013A6A9EF|nr:glycosyltransferase [Roseovarius amoyensis]